MIILKNSCLEGLSAISSRAELASMAEDDSLLWNRAGGGALAAAEEGDGEPWTFLLTASASLVTSD